MTSLQRLNESTTGFSYSLMISKFALVIHDYHLLRMIEYTEINLISKHWNMQPAKLLIEINIL